MIKHKHFMWIISAGENWIFWHCAICDFEYTAKREDFWRVSESAVPSIYKKMKIDKDDILEIMDINFNQSAYLLETRMSSSWFENLTEAEKKAMEFDYLVRDNPSFLIPSLPWAGFFQRRCSAVLEPREDADYYGRCELKRNHGDHIDHALERGFNTPRWSTERTDY
jgi:hypothetical protein